MQNGPANTRVKSSIRTPESSPDFVSGEGFAVEYVLPCVQIVLVAVAIDLGISVLVCRSNVRRSTVAIDALEAMIVQTDTVCA